MNIIKFSFLCLTILWTGSASAEVCEDEIKHLQEFGVHYLPKATARNSNFIYKDIPNSNATLAIAKSESSNLKIDILSKTDGYAFVARGMIVGISGEFDKNGECKNAVTFEYDVMGNRLPESVANNLLSFNYNFQVCQKVEKLLSQRHLIVGPDNAESVANELMKKQRSLYLELQKLTQPATENKFYKISKPTVSTLMMKCMTAIGNRKSIEARPLTPDHLEKAKATSTK